MASCLPPGGPRQFQVPYGVEILEHPDRKRMFVMSGGGNRNWRLIYLDGRAAAQNRRRYFYILRRCGRPVGRRYAGGRYARL